MTNIFVTAQTSQAVAELQKLRLSGMSTWNTMGTVAEYAAIGVAAAAGSIWLATAAVEDWHKSMVNAAAIGGLTTDQMWELADASVEAGKQVGIASSEIAEGYLELTRAGYQDMNEIMEMNNVIMKAAVANQIAYGEAAEVTIKSLNAFGIGVSEAEEHVGVLQYIANQTLADFSTFADVMRYAGSTAAFAGVEFNELASMMGVLTDIAMEAGIGARGLNQMILDMVKSADEFSEFARRMGVEVEVFTKEGTLNLSEIIMKFGELGITMEVLQESAGEFNVRALRSWLGLIGNAERYQELLQGTGDAADYFNRTYLQQLQNIDVVLGMIREEFLAIFRNKETVELLRDFFFQLRAWVTGGLAERIGDLMRVLMEGFIVNGPAIINLVTTLLNTFQTLAPVFMYLANLVTKFAGGGLLELYVLFSLISSMMPAMTAGYTLYAQSLEIVAFKKQLLNNMTMQERQALIQADLAQRQANLGKVMAIAHTMALTIALDSLAVSLSAIVGGMFSFMMITQMWNESGSTMMKIALMIVAAITMMTVAQTVFNAVKAFGNSLQMGVPPWVAGAIAIAASVAVLGGGIMMAKDMREQQEAEMASMRSGMSGEYAAWQSEMGIPTAHGGEWKVPGSRDTLRVVSPGERILKPDDAEYSRKYGLGNGGGHTTIINIAEGAYVADDILKLIADENEKQFQRQLRGMIH